MEPAHIAKFNCRWYKTWKGCLRAAHEILPKLEPCIATALPRPFCKDDTWCVAFHGNKPCGILKCGTRPLKDTPTSFICDIGTTRKRRGAGEALFLAFVERFGTTFWLCCLDKNARMFWQHMGRKHKILFKTIGRTEWNTSILMFNN